MDRRSLIVRSVGLAGAGLVVGGLPVAELVQAAAPGGTDVGTHQAKVREITGSHAHAQLTRALAMHGAHLGPEGGLIAADNVVLRSVITTAGQRGLARIERGPDGASNAAAVIQSASNKQLILGVRTGFDGKLLQQVTQTAEATSPLFVPPGYLELPAGATVVSNVPSLTPTAGAQSLNCWGCVLQTAYICWEAPAMICNVNGVCQVLVALVCGAVSFWVCGHIAC